MNCLRLSLKSAMFFIVHLWILLSATAAVVVSRPCRAEPSSNGSFKIAAAYFIQCTFYDGKNFVFEQFQCDTVREIDTGSWMTASEVRVGIAALIHRLQQSCARAMARAALRDPGKIVIRLLRRFVTLRAKRGYLVENTARCGRYTIYRIK